MLYVGIAICVSACLYRMNVQCLRGSYYAFPHNCYTLILQSINLYFILIYSFFLSFFLRSFRNFISGRYCTLLQCFGKGCIQSNQHLDLSRFLHSVHCGGAVFPYEALERIPAQDTLICCAGLHNNFKGIELSLCIS
jgi:hypothetical protein